MHGDHLVGFLATRLSFLTKPFGTFPSESHFREAGSFQESAVRIPRQHSTSSATLFPLRFVTMKKWHQIPTALQSIADAAEIRPRRPPNKNIRTATRSSKHHMLYPSAGASKRSFTKGLWLGALSRESALWRFCRIQRRQVASRWSCTGKSAIKNARLVTLYFGLN